jgi:hypothetical protein
MAIQLDTLALPDGLLWSDEFAADAVSQSMRRRLNGAVTLYPRGNIAGRPITIEARADQWITRAQAEGLLLLAAAPGAIYDLTFSARIGAPTFRVAFRHHDPPALELTPLVDYADPLDDDPIVGTIKLLTV